MDKQNSDTDDEMDYDKTEMRVNEQGNEVPKGLINQQNITQVDPQVLEKTEYNEIIKAGIWGGVQHLKHLALVGATSAGKTTYFKQLLADQKIPTFDIYITLGNMPGADELQIGYAASNYLFGIDHSNIESYHYTFDNYAQALNKARSPEIKDKSKLLFLNDAMIQSSKLTKEISDFMNQAKNYNITCVVEVHDFFGKDMKMARKACTYSIFFKVSAAELSRALEIEKKAPLIRAYEMKDLDNRILIFDRDADSYYNSNYVSFV